MKHSVLVHRVNNGWFPNPGKEKTNSGRADPCGPAPSGWGPPCGVICRLELELGDIHPSLAGTIGSPVAVTCPPPDGFRGFAVWPLSPCPSLEVLG